MSESGGPQRLQDLLGRAGGSGQREDRQALAIWKIWPEIVGAQLARHSQPSTFRNHVLTVMVSAAPWMQELQLLKQRIRSQINERLGSTVISDICFLAGTLARPNSVPPSQPSAAEAALVTSRTVEMPRMANQELQLAFENVLAARARRAAAARQQLTKVTPAKSKKRRARGKKS